MAMVRPQSMIITLYGDYVRTTGGCIGISSLIQLLGHFGFSPRAVRSAVSRMKRDDLLAIDRRKGRSYYALTRKSATILEEGAARIFHFPTHSTPWDRCWRMVTYSIPENERAVRDRLRRGLSWLGFGMLTVATWVSPYDRRAEVESLADGLGARAHIEFFTARHDGFADDQTIVARCWDLESINNQYAAFVRKFKPMYEKQRRILAQGKDLEPSQYFVNRLTLIHEFRRFPYTDPNLPVELLPVDWRGAEAATLFRQYHDLLSEKANTYFLSVCKMTGGA